MIRFRYGFVRIFAQSIIVIDHVYEKQFFVSNLFAVIQVVIDGQSRR